MLKKESFYLEFDTGLFCDQLLPQTSELALGFLMSGGDGDMSEQSLCSVLGEFAGIERVGL